MSAKSQLSVGWATVSITPDAPVQLLGYFHERVSQYVHDPVMATALALEEVGGGQAVIVSCDLLWILQETLDELREIVGPRCPGLDPRAILVAATHPHTAPCTLSKGWWYRYPDPGVVGPNEYRPFLLARLSEVIARAWNERRSGGVSWALGHAAVGFCRRVVYDDGTARMYGSSDTPHFMGLEGSQDHGVELLYTWDTNGELTGVVANVACPSQVVEAESYVSADFWGAARRQLAQRHGRPIPLAALCGAGGDQSPRDLVRRNRGEPNMRQLDGMEEMGRRIVAAIEEMLLLARTSIQWCVLVRHVVEDLVLPGRQVTTAEAEEARGLYEEIKAREPIDERSGDFYWMRRWQSTMARYRRQGEHPQVPIEVHALRVGDVALATNPFELFLDYGLRIKARSVAPQTMIAQLACDWQGYLPTTRAVAGGHYGARVSDGTVGPEGGQMLVDRTVELIGSLWVNHT